MDSIKITHNQFIGVYENVLNQEECKKIIELFENDLNNQIETNSSSSDNGDN